MLLTIFQRSLLNKLHVDNLVPQNSLRDDFHSNNAWIRGGAWWKINSGTPYCHV